MDHIAMTGLFAGMLLQQFNMNTASYDAEWLEKGRTLDFDYGLQASQELSEFHESYGKGRWWGNVTTDEANCRTELVDALHFGMSMDLIMFGSVGEHGARQIAPIYSSAVKKVRSDPLMGKQELTAKDVTAIGKKLQAHALTQPNFDFALFYRLCLAVNMDVELIRARYMAKAFLNEFRQANGYSDKPRTYVKEWGARKEEDNFYIANFVDTYPNSTDEEIKEYILRTYNTIRQGGKLGLPKDELTTVA